MILSPTVSLILIAIGALYEPLMGGDVSRLNLLINDISHANLEIFKIITLSTVMFPLIMGLIGIILSTKLSDKVDQKLILMYSIVLILYNIPIYPQTHFYRLNLMTSILAPPILGLLAGYFKDIKYSIVILLLIFSFIIPEFSHQLLTMKPSIPLGEYNEIGHLVETIPNNTAYIVPDIRLKYWVETYGVSVFKSPIEAPTLSYKILIIEKTQRLHGYTHPKLFNPPPNSRLIYDGEYIQAYRLSL